MSKEKDDLTDMVDKRLRDYKRDAGDKIDDVRRDTNEKINRLESEDVKIQGDVFRNRDRIKDLEHHNVIEKTRKEIWASVVRWIAGIVAGVAILVVAAMLFAGYEIVGWVISEMGTNPVEMPK